VSWNEAARFINWLNTSQGYLPAYKFTTQPGDGGYSVNSNITLWTSGDAGYNPANPFRNSQTHYFLPSIDEWYKAAFYNASSGMYVVYPTGSITAPTPVASGTSPGTAVFNGQAGPADVNLAGGLSLYGTMGQGGNASEWEETESDLVNDTPSAARAFRGSFWGSASFILQSSIQGSVDPSVDGLNDGFRVASVPEPTPLLYGGLLTLGVFCWRRIALRRRLTPR
jgi:formylglycine-generating enzyme required for sulfatase activity